MALFDRTARPGSISMADRAREAGEWKAAARHYRTALERNPDNPPIWVQYGHALKESGQLVPAEAAYRRALAAAPGVADTYVQLGHSLKLQNRREEARAAYLRALTLDPECDPARSELSGMGWREDELADVQRVVRTAATAVRRRRASTIMLADRARDLGQWEVAAQLYRKALHRNSRRPEIWLQNGHMLKELGRLAEAAAAYRQALLYQPRAAEPYLQLGHVLKMQGRCDEAQAAYLRALALDATLPDSIQALGNVGWSTQQINELRALSNGAAEPDAASTVLLPQLQPEQVSTSEGFRQDIVEDHSRPLAGLGLRDYASVLPPSPRQFRVLYISGPCDSPSHQYRVTHYIEALTEIGIEAEWIPADDCERAIDRLRAVSLLVIFRAGFNAQLARLIHAARLYQVPVVFDVDDYVFEPQVAKPEIIDGIRGWSNRDIEGYRSGVRGYRAMLLSCQFATFTTKFLVDRGEELGRRSFLLPNGLGVHILDRSRAIGRTPQDQLVRLGYMGGTRTHQKDFAQCAAAVARVLRENPDCRLVLFRDDRDAPFLRTSEFSGFVEIEDQIEWRYFVAFEHVPEEIARFDINLAPVEIGNPFCEAKSDLKYFEAACLGVPTVASANTVFREAIQEGVTGYLAITQAGWYDALSALVRNPSLREQVGAAARRQAVDAYNPAAQCRAAKQAYTEIIRAYRAGMGRADSTLTIRMVLSKHSPERPQHATAISLMRGLWNRGHDIELHFAEDEFETVDHIRREYGLPEGVIISSRLDPRRPCDVLIANFWQTAYRLRNWPGEARTSIYLLQDYEPFFYPMGEEYIAAEQSYRLGLQHISYGPWVRRQVEQQIGVQSDWIQYFVDKSTYYRDPEVRRSSDRLVVLMRPEEKRYLSELAAAAVALFIEQTGFTGTVEFFGSDTQLDLPFSHLWHGAIAADQAAALFREATLGMALSGANAFAVTFEMMACGLPVIDIDYHEKHICYGGYDTVCLVRPTPQALAVEIARLFRDEAVRDLLAGHAHRFAAQLPDDAMAAAQLEELLRSRLAAQETSSAESQSSLAERRPTLGRTGEVKTASNGHDPGIAVARETAAITPARAQMPELQPARGLRIDWLLNGLEVGGGGTRNILRAAYYLEKFGHDIGLIFDVDGHEAAKLQLTVQQHFYPFKGPVKIYDGTFRAADAIIATHWSTVAPALAARASVREVMYFVQDFEPFFYPMSTDHILAENTYRLGLYCICSGAWCSERLRAQFGAAADSFKFPLDPSIYHPRPRQKENLNITFFARPEMPRRCYGLGIAMLRDFHRLRPDVEIILYGSDKIDASKVDFPVTLYRVVPTLDDLAQMYSDADLGVAFGTTNPSLVPYEMMACGLPVVDLARPGAELNYGNRTDIALLASPMPQEMARQVCELLDDRAQRESRSTAGRLLIEQFPTERGMARRVEELIIDRLTANAIIAA